jgi:hypothetical protein
MRRPRFSIGRLMIVVGLIALNLSAGWALLAIEPWLLIGVAPAGLELQWAAFRMIGSRGRARAFWAGFLAAGTLAAWSLVGAMLFLTSLNMAINRTTGQSMTLTTPDLVPPIKPGLRGRVTSSSSRLAWHARRLPQAS